MLILLSLLVLSIGWIIYIQKKYDRVCRDFRRYESLATQEGFLEKLNLDIENNYRENNQLSHEKEQLEDRVLELRSQVEELEEEVYVQSFGFYIQKFDFIRSEEYENQRKQILTRQKEMIKNDEAAICRTTWVVKDSKKEGEKLAKNFLKLVLTLFNGECDNIISKVKPSNVQKSENEIKKAHKKLNQLSRIIDCEITETYLDLKLRELYAKYELECKKQEEKEQEQELRMRIKQEEKERRKLDEENRKIQEAEAREEEFQRKINEAQQQLSSLLRNQELVAEQEKKSLESQIEMQKHEIEACQQLLAQASSDKEEAISRSAMIKAGYIYVISNVGSLGENIYRICMTKRSNNEDEYVNEMKPNVPFPFDVHIKFMSQDAFDTLNRLHQRFSDRRVNKVNIRRDFFNVSFDEICQAVEEIKHETGMIKGIQFDKAPQAYEYRRTRATERKEATIANYETTDSKNIIA